MNPAWIDLLNSDYRDYRGQGRSEDRLENTEWLRRFLSSLRTKLTKAPLNAIRSSLRNLRALLQRIVDSLVSGRGVPKRDLAALNTVIAGAALVQQVEKGNEGYQLKLVPTKENLKSLISEIALSFAEALTLGDPARIKKCENPDCLWIFYDVSKNGSRRWCEGAGCGNLMKVRRFRARKKRKKQSGNEKN